MIRSVGIDFHEGQHQVRCLDEGAQLCDDFSFRTTPQGLATLEECIFRDGSNLIVVFEPMGLAWLIVAAYLRARHPGCRLVKAKGQKVAALRRYLRGSAKSDRIDALTLAKMPFIDPEQLAEVYLPPAEVHALQRLTRQRQRLEREIVARKNRIGRIADGYLPGVREAFSSPWSLQARAFLHSQLDPFAVVHAGEELRWSPKFGQVVKAGSAPRIENRIGGAGHETEPQEAQPIVQGPGGPGSLERRGDHS
jgi:transposase